MSSSGGAARRTVLVTGGASGIGLALGAELHRKGARVVLADIDGEAATQRADAIVGSSESDTVVGRQLDVTDEAAFRQLVAEIVSRDGKLDMLFNNAGVSLGGPTHEFAPAHWDHVIDVNIRGVVNGVLAAYPTMIKQGHGHIVNTASAAGLVPPPFVAPYAMTKHAVVGLSNALRPEAALHGVKVSVLCPGSVETPILDRAAHPDLPVTTSRAVTAREYLRVARQKPIGADDFARQALNGVDRNKAVIVAPATARFLWYLDRMSPSLVRRVTTSLARKVDRQLVRPRVP